MQQTCTRRGARAEGHVAARPAGAGFCFVDRAAAAALAVYLVVFQHVPVEQCRQLIAVVTGAACRGFIHSCLARQRLWPRSGGADPRLDHRRPGRRFDETTLQRAGRGEMGAARSPSSIRFLARRPQPVIVGRRLVPSGFAGSSRLPILPPRWERIAGPGMSLAPLSRFSSSVPRASLALSALSVSAISALLVPLLSLLPLSYPGRRPRRHPSLWSTNSGTPSSPAGRVPRSRPVAQHVAEAQPRAADSALPSHRRAALHLDTSLWPSYNISYRSVLLSVYPAEDLRPPGQRCRHPGPSRYPQLHRHRSQARQEYHGVLHDLMLSSPWRPPAPAFYP